LEGKNKFIITVYTSQDYYALEKTLRELEIREKIGYYEINDPKWKK